MRVTLVTHSIDNGGSALAFARERFDPEKSHAALEAIIVGEGGMP